MAEITIIIPTLNEEKNIGALLDTIKELYPQIPVLVADDGSKDKTRSIAKKKGADVLDRTHEPIKGICASIVDGAAHLTTDNFVVIDGDFQHPPEKIKDMIEKLKQYDVAIGTRVKVASEWPLFRRLMSKTATLLGRLRLMFKPSRGCDIMSGFFGINTKLFNKTYRLHKTGYELEGYKVLFNTLKYLPQRTSIAEVSYVFGERKFGYSKINNKQVWLYLKSLLK
jgi:dolichol-phosphate mannosyltransferase